MGEKRNEWRNSKWVSATQPLAAIKEKEKESRKDCLRAPSSNTSTKRDSARKSERQRSETARKLPTMFDFEIAQRRQKHRLSKSPTTNFRPLFGERDIF